VGKRSVGLHDQFVTSTWTNCGTTCFPSTEGGSPPQGIGSGLVALANSKPFGMHGKADACKGGYSLDE